MRTAWISDGTVAVVEAPEPEPGPDEAVVRISTCGVCHSDLHLARGDWDFAPPSGRIGHEAVGLVEAVGPGADRFVSLGARVILGLGGAGGGYWCGTCAHCLAGTPRHCSQARGVIGAFAERIGVWAPALVELPDAVGDHEAPLACGGLTAYGAVKKLLEHRVRPGGTVAVVGAAGGLGHYAVQLATAFGYRVVGVDVGEERLDFVRSLGAELALDAAAAREVVQRELGGVDASLVFTAHIAGYGLGFDLLGKAGLLVTVGLPATSEGPFELDPFALFAKDPTIVFSAVGTVQDMRELVGLAERGVVSTHVARVGSLEELPSVLDDLEAGRYLGRAVIDIG